MPDDGLRRELVRGELRTMNPAGHPHGRVAMRFGWPLAQHVEENGLGVVYAAKTGFVLESNPDTVRAPDVAFVRRDRVEEVGETAGFFPARRTLRSRSSRPATPTRRSRRRLRDGCRMVIVADGTNRAIRAHRSSTDVTTLIDDDEIDGADVVPGWGTSGRRLFGG
jgi:hypothetical protein